MGNTLFAFKLRTLSQEVDRLVKKKTKNLEEKLDLIMAKLGIEQPAEEENSTENPNAEEESVFPEVAPVPESVTSLSPDNQEAPATEMPQESDEEEDNDRLGTTSLFQMSGRPFPSSSSIVPLSHSAYPPPSPFLRPLPAFRRNDWRLRPVANRQVRAPSA